ncbi:MAG TPA: hypothetical protein ENJ95_05680 [Bacteroidetes bacterium]|nr:hypothetical protein [Bacteroidota bacterium]
MKNTAALLLFLSTAIPLLSQETGKSYPLLAVKYSPTSLFNPYTGTFLTGIEIWPSEKMNFQFEYGHQFLAFNDKDWSRDKEQQFYRKYKFGLRYHYYQNFRQPPLLFYLFWWNALLPPGRRRFIGFDFIAFPQSYVDNNGRVLLEDGTALAYTQAKINKNAVAATLVLGSQIPLGKGFFAELYAGIGVKWKNVAHELDPMLTTPISSFSVSFPYDFSPDNVDGRHALPYVDFGIKFGFGFLEK